MFLAKIDPFYVKKGRFLNRKTMLFRPVRTALPPATTRTDTAASTCPKSVIDPAERLL